ncbi:MAG: hypothetical protein MK116_03980 [Phycisphaerales bacterium]|nr:hypothetical protein [Phycisphaerales bacterium]
MHRIGIIIAAAMTLGSTVTGQSIEDLRPPSGVAGTSPTAGNDALLQGMLNLEARQPGLVPVLAGRVTLESTAEEIAEAQARIQGYVDETVDVLVTGGLLVNSTMEPPLPQESLVAFMQGQMFYIAAISAPLGFDTDALYHGIALDIRFQDIDADVQAAMIGGYVQGLLVKTERTTTETSVLTSVETPEFIEALSLISGVSTGVEDPRELDWDGLVGQTIDIRYFNERLRLTERTVEVLDYDRRFGVILPPMAENEANVNVKISRIEYVRITEG